MVKTVHSGDSCSTCEMQSSVAKLFYSIREEKGVELRTGNIMSIKMFEASRHAGPLLGKTERQILATT